jgi:hypothetical protein
MGTNGITVGYLAKTCFVRVNMIVCFTKAFFSSKTADSVTSAVKLGELVHDSRWKNIYEDERLVSWRGGRELTPTTIWPRF